MVPKRQIIEYYLSTKLINIFFAWIVRKLSLTSSSALKVFLRLSTVILVCTKNPLTVHMHIQPLYEFGHHT